MSLHIDFIIFIEHRTRDLENACLLKYELERRGYSVRISSALYWRYQTTLHFYKPTIVITPWLYNNKYIRVVSNFRKQKPKNILNLQCEQVVNSIVSDNNYYMPIDLAKNFYHVCWGKYKYDYLSQRDIAGDHLLIDGALSTDFSRPIFESYLSTKHQMSQQYQLDPTKHWCLFLSSFNCSQTYVDLFIKDNNGKGYSNTVIELGELQKKSRPIILDWIKQFLLEHPDHIFIYRPHPGEVSDASLIQLTTELDRFYVISDNSMRNWSNVCDSVNSWLSTSIFELYFMHKNCSVLRPVMMDRAIEYNILDPDKYICDYQTFCDYQLNPECFSTPVFPNILKENYLFDEIPAYIKICDDLEKLYHQKQNPAIFDTQLDPCFEDNLRKGMKKILFMIYCSLSVHISFSRFLKGTKQYTAKRIEKESRGIYKEIRKIEKKIHRTLDND